MNCIWRARHEIVLFDCVMVNGHRHIEIYWYKLQADIYPIYNTASCYCLFFRLFDFISRMSNWLIGLKTMLRYHNVHPSLWIDNHDVVYVENCVFLSSPSWSYNREAEYGWMSTLRYISIFSEWWYLLNCPYIDQWETLSLEIASYVL